MVRYRHVLDEQWSLDPPQLAVLACLLLRGAQTVGELRARTERMVSFEDVGETEHTLELLADREVPLTAPVPRRPGQKEARWTQLLAPGAESEGPGPTILSDRPPPEGDHDTLRAEVDELRRQLDDLRSLVENLRTSLGG